MKLLMLDNYDSFTYNLAYLIKETGCEIEVLRNDKCTPETAKHFDGVILSPGPGVPSESGNMPVIIDRLKGQLPMLGVCLGHQAIAESLGAQLSNMPIVHHGIQSTVRVQRKESCLLHGLPMEFKVGRYHSWQVSKESLPGNVHVTVVDQEGQIMALECPELRMYGLQFHPESVMTPKGATLIHNFIQICRK